MCFNVCDKCGANLDPGEKCECKESEEEADDWRKIDAYSDRD